MDTQPQKNDPNIVFPYYYFEDKVSGNKTEDNTIYKMAYPSSVYPMLHLGFPIYDNVGNKLDPGHYEVALSADQKSLLLIQSKRLIAKVPIIKLEHLDKEKEEKRELFMELEEKLEKYQVNNNKKKIAHYKKELEYQQHKLLVKNKVELDDTHPEYFIIDYYCNFTKAIGFIKRASQD